MSTKTEDEEIDAGDQSGEDDDDEGLSKRRGTHTGRSVTLSMLMTDGVLQHGENVLSIDYLGSRFTGDLMKDGKIKWRETQEIYSSPSSWAVHCKKLLNPDKKSGCGWSTIRYKGKKLDWYKATWFRKQRNKKEDRENSNGNRSTPGEKTKSGLVIKKPLAYQNPVEPSTPKETVILNHGALGTRNVDCDLNTLVVATPFSMLDRIQPFTLTVSTNCLLLIDFHCHLTESEVVGYLGGTWDVAAHNVSVLQAFPCRTRLADRESALSVEEEIRQSLEQRHLMLIGWYHSHPRSAAQPSLRDCNCQLEYQTVMKGDSDSAYTPCVGLICSPYAKNESCVEAKYLAYWVMPPPEHRPNEYGKPMQMIYNIAQDSFLTQDLLMEMRLLSEYYRSAPDSLNFCEEFKPHNISYWGKLKRSLTSKLPRDLQVTTNDAQGQAVDHFWEFVKGLIMPV
ncbi:MPN domain-containing protein-like [Ornithodoros turicata]|uniref:Putative histone h2a deubiquitinase n=1 Tax=Ornithodoros turicata TaxID=34597 RepID=A0A2R5LLI7_9ACAR